MKTMACYLQSLGMQRVNIQQSHLFRDNFCFFFFNLHERLIFFRIFDDIVIVHNENLSIFDVICFVDLEVVQCSLLFNPLCAAAGLSWIKILYYFADSIKCNIQNFIEPVDSIKFGVLYNYVIYRCSKKHFSSTNKCFEKYISNGLIYYYKRVFILKISKNL